MPPPPPLDIPGPPTTICPHEKALYHPISQSSPLCAHVCLSVRLPACLPVPACLPSPLPTHPFPHLSPSHLGAQLDCARDPSSDPAMEGRDPVAINPPSFLPSPSSYVVHFPLKTPSSSSPSSPTFELSSPLLSPSFASVTLQSPSTLHRSIDRGNGGVCRAHNSPDDDDVAERNAIEIGSRSDRDGGDSIGWDTVPRQINT